MTLGQGLRLLILYGLVYQASSGPWYYFEAYETSTYSDDASTFEFYLDEVEDPDGYEFDYDNAGDMGDGMSNHKLLVDLTNVLALVVLAIGLFGISSIENAKRACLALVLLSLLNGVAFALMFPWALEEEVNWFTSYGIDETEVSFLGTAHVNNIQYDWGPRFAWISSTIIIPIYGMLLRLSMEEKSSSAKSKKVAISNQKQYSQNYLHGGRGGYRDVAITVPNVPIVPNLQTGSAGINNLASHRSQTAPSYEPANENNIWETTDVFKDNDLASHRSQTAPSHEPVNENNIWGTTDVFKDGSISSKKISFSRPDLKETYDMQLLLTGERSVYSIEGLITLSGCSEILFGTRKTDGRMVVVKRPYGYKKKEEKGKGGKVNTYASAKKQLENEYQVLSRMMKYNKTNFPELLDYFNQKIGRRKDLYMATKYFSPSLKKYVEFHGGKRGGLEFKRALNLLREIAAAVKEIHEKLGYVWADLKSENILMQEDTPVLIDFGTSTPPISGKGRVKIDSGGWSAPETIEGAPVFESDIYSLGKLFVYLLTEIQPRAKQKFDVFSAQVSHELKKRNIDARIAEIITKCSSEKIADRYGSVSELLDDLQDFWQELRIQCPDCNRILGIHAKFCKACGKKKTGKTWGKKKTKTVKKRKKAIKKKAKICVECDKILDDDSRYCKFCGTDVVQPDQSKIQCPDCEEFIQSSAKYCNNCGTAVKERVK